MIGHGQPLGPVEAAINAACTALIERCHKAEARARELEELLAWERLHRIESEGCPF
jgi:hypothetical protein